MAKIYNKKGNLTAEEKRYVKELQKFMSNNPDKEIATSKNFSQLKKAYNKYCVEEVEYVETEKSEDEKRVDEILREQEEALERDSRDSSSAEGEDEIDDDDLPDNNSDTIDPFNEHNPIIRDHVLSETFSKEQASQSSQSSFSEPTNFRDSFQIPKDENQENLSGEPKKEKSEKQKSEPVNPAFDDMSGAKKKKSTRRFAKYITEFVCMCAEKGFVWYSNRNIDTNIFVLKEEFGLTPKDLQTIMVTLSQGQQASVIQFFEIQKSAAIDLAKIDEEDKKELADALSEWLLEKGFAPNATQELLIVALTILGKQALILMAHTASTNSVVVQMRGGAQGKTEDIAHEEVKETTKEEVKKAVDPEPIEQKVSKKKAAKEKEGEFKQKQIGDSTKE